MVVVVVTDSGQFWRDSQHRADWRTQWAVSSLETSADV